MFENFGNFFKKMVKPETAEEVESKEAAKERLQLVLMQDRANVSADFLELMKQEIIDVIKKYIEVDENAIDVRLTTQVNEDGTNGAPALYANIPIINIKNEARKIENTKKEEKQIEKQNNKTEKEQEKKEDKKQEEKQDKQENKKEIKEQTKKENQEKEEDKNQKEEQLENQPKEKEEQNEEKITQIKENKEKGSKKESAKEEIKSKK